MRTLSCNMIFYVQWTKTYVQCIFVPKIYIHHMYLRIDILSRSQGCLVCVCVCENELIRTFDILHAMDKNLHLNVSSYQKPTYVIRIYVLIFYKRWVPSMNAINGRIYTYLKPTWTLMDVSTSQNLRTSLMTNTINDVYN
jgi:hypothetical protein